MKFLKILAVIMAVCLLGTAFIACDKGDKGNETGDDTKGATSVSVTLIIKEGSATKYEETIKCDGTLGDAIEMFCAGEFDEEFVIFDETTGLLKNIGDLSAGDGKSWKAYYQEAGQSNAFESIKDQELIDGRTVVVVLE